MFHSHEKLDAETFSFSASVQGQRVLREHSPTPAPRKQLALFVLPVLSGMLLCLLLGGIVGWQAGKSSSQQGIPRTRMELQAEQRQAGEQANVQILSAVLCLVLGGLAGWQLSRGNRSLAPRERALPPQGQAASVPEETSKPPASIATDYQVLANGVRYQVVLCNAATPPQSVVSLDSTAPSYKLSAPASLLALPAVLPGTPLTRIIPLDESSASQQAETVRLDRERTMLRPSGPRAMSILASHATVKPPLAPSVVTHTRCAETVLRALGVSVSDAGGMLDERVVLTSKQGVLLVSVAADGPAVQAGLRPGDRIVQLNAKPLGNVEEMLHLLSTLAPGTLLTLGVLRGNEHTWVKMTRV